jgi:hypothetical protein
VGIAAIQLAKVVERRNCRYRPLAEPTLVSLRTDVVSEGGIRDCARRPDLEAPEHLGEPGAAPQDF